MGIFTSTTVEGWNSSRSREEIVISTYMAILLLVAHFVGDFVLQNSWMALGKSKFWTPLLVHIAVYTAVLLPFGIVYALVNGAAHLMTDYFSSRINAKNWAKQNYRAFWIGIGADQLIHTACLLGTYSWLA
jgi:hypothetical protein